MTAIRSKRKATRAPLAVLQFRVELRGIAPPIWRRIVVPAQYSFWDLHVAIQDAMGWEDRHLHVFRTLGDEDGRREIGIPAEKFGGPPFEPGWEVPLIEVFRQAGDSAVYEYDFGDSWEHEVVLEAVLLREIGGKYPHCVAGERAGPPEDCGGPPGYELFLKAIADPTHEQHAELLECVGGSFDPEAFDPARVKFENPAKRWKQAFQR